MSIIGSAAIAAALPGLIETGTDIIKRLVPDEEAQRQAVMELQFRVQELHARVTMAQIEVNKASASHPSLFVAGARPAAIWASLGGIAYSSVGVSLLTWLGQFWGFEGPPQVDTTALVAMLSGLLGVTTQRHLEAQKGTKRDNLKARGDAKEPELSPNEVTGIAVEIANKYAGDQYDN